MREGHRLEPQGTLCMGGCRASIQAAGFPWLPVSPEENQRECSQLLSTFPVKTAITSTQSWRMFQTTLAFHTQETELATERNGRLTSSLQKPESSVQCCRSVPRGTYKNTRKVWLMKPEVNFPGKEPDRMLPACLAAGHSGGSGTPNKLGSDQSWKHSTRQTGPCSSSKMLVSVSSLLSFFLRPNYSAQCLIQATNMLYHWVKSLD